MLRVSFLLLSVIALQAIGNVGAMECNMLGISVNCPTSLDDNNKAFCCVSSISDSIHYCCDIEEYFKQNVGIIVGILIAAVVLLIICTVCCCCFCSCCLLAKRRTHQGRVLYDPVNVNQDLPSAITSTSYVHPPPPTQFHGPPPPSYHPAFPQSQPPLNPNYKY